MKRAFIGLVAASLLIVALPALGKGVAGIEIMGPGITKPLVIESDGTSATQELVNRWVEAIGMEHLIYGADGGGITAGPPTEILGPEYELTFLHMVPGGVTEIPGSLYPFAEGGALVFVERGLPIGEPEVSVLGGWFRSDTDVVALLEEYGVDVASIDPKAVGAPESQTPASPGWLTPLFVVVVAGLVGLWAVWRRPATSPDVAAQPSR